MQIFGCADDVWRTITDYERLSDVVPAIATSTLVAPPHGHAYPAGMHRLRQLAVKQLPYMQLHTEVVLDVLEREAEGLRRELQFRAHRSDFDILRVREPPAHSRTVARVPMLRIRLSWTARKSLCPLTVWPSV